MYRLGLGKKPDVCVNPTFGLFGKNANRFEKPRLYMLYSVSAKFTVLFPCNMYVPNCMRESVVSRQISGRFPMSHVDLGFCREDGLRSHVDLGTIGLTGPRSQDDMGQNPRWYLLTGFGQLDTCVQLGKWVVPLLNQKYD